MQDAVAVSYAGWLLFLHFIDPTTARCIQLSLAQSLRGSDAAWVITTYCHCVLLLYPILQVQFLVVPILLGIYARHLMLCTCVQM